MEGHSVQLNALMLLDLSEELTLGKVVLPAYQFVWESGIYMANQKVATVAVGSPSPNSVYDVGL